MYPGTHKHQDAIEPRPSKASFSRTLLIPPVVGHPLIPNLLFAPRTLHSAHVILEDLVSLVDAEATLAEGLLDGQAQGAVDEAPVLQGQVAAFGVVDASAPVLDLAAHFFQFLFLFGTRTDQVVVLGRVVRVVLLLILKIEQNLSGNRPMETSRYLYGYSRHCLATSQLESS